MPDYRRVQGPEESISPLLYLREEDKPRNKLLVTSDGRRLDRRKHSELRPMYINTEVNPHVTGSAYVEVGKTKVICTIYGPKEPARKEEFASTGRLVCDFKFAPFSCARRRQYQQDSEEKDFSSIVCQALHRAIRLDTFPKLQLEINIFVVENGGSALAVALNCASLALVDSGLELFDLPVACSMAVHKSDCLVDPAVSEEYTNDEVIKHPAVTGMMTVIYLPSFEEVTGFKQNGLMDKDVVYKGVDLCVEGCVRVHRRIREHLATEA